MGMTATSIISFLFGMIRSICIFMCYLNLLYFPIKGIAQDSNEKSISKDQNSLVLPPKIVLAGKPITKSVPGIQSSIFQDNIKSKSKKFNDYKIAGIGNFVNYTTEQGVPLSSISCSLSDKFGNLWFGTFGGGVCRYDGKAFTTYSREDGLINNYTVCLFEDKSGNIWFGNTEGGVSCYNGKSFKSWTIENKLPDNIITSICEDKEGNLLFGTKGFGVSNFNGKSFTKYTKKQGLSDNDVYSIIVDKRGIIWIGTNYNGICRFDGKSFYNIKMDQEQLNFKDNKLYEDSKSNIWIATKGSGLLKYDGKSFQRFTTKDGLSSNIINCVYEDRKGLIWIGTVGGGLCSYNGQAFNTYSSARGLVNDEVTTIIEDQAGKLWLGTNGGAVCSYDGEAFTSFTTKQGLSNNCVWSIAEDKNGMMWFADDLAGLSRFDGESVINYNSKSTLINHKIYGLYTDKQGNIWIGTREGGISCFDGKVLTTYTTDQGLSNNYVVGITQDSKGRLWFGTFGGGVNCFDGKQFTIYTEEQGLCSNYIVDICEDKNGMLWFASDGGGVSSFDPNKVDESAIFTNYTVYDGLAHNTINCVTLDSAGNLWFGSYGGGVSYFDGKSFSTYTTADGLSDNIVMQIVQDVNSRIYIGTNWGISIIVGWKGNIPIFENYNKRTGYPVKDVNQGFNSMLVDSRGIVWAGTGDDKTALVRFDYKALRKNKNSPLAFIQNIKINEQNVSWYSLLKRENRIDSATIAQQEIMTLGKVQSANERVNISRNFDGVEFDSIRSYYQIPENLVLPYKHNHITFEFAAIEPSRPAMVNYQYFLKGYDAQWSPISNKSYAVYGNIGEGTYIFMLKAQSPDGIWSQPVTYTFKVLPPWYRTLWAYLSYFIGFVILLYIGVKKYTSNLLKEKILLERIVKERTTELQNQLLELNTEVERRTKTEKLLLENETQLKELNSTKDKLFSIIAHDLRSPFNGILGLMQVLKDSIRSQSIEKSELMLNHIYSANQSTFNLLETLLDWAKTQTQQISIKPVALNLTQIIENCIAGFETTSLNKNIKIEFTWQDKIIVSSDENMINSIIRNLISNSIKYSKIGGSIKISQKVNSEFVEVAFTDDGVGIKEDVKKRLFSSNINESGFGTSNEKGSGLGLVICKEFVEKLGGKIWVESEEGKGSCFTFSLPYTTVNS